LGFIGEQGDRRECEEEAAAGDEDHAGKPVLVWDSGLFFRRSCGACADVILYVCAGKSHSHALLIPLPGPSEVGFSIWFPVFLQTGDETATYVGVLAAGGAGSRKGGSWDAVCL
jgi:hypothetical protein